MNNGTKKCKNLTLTFWKESASYIPATVDYNKYALSLITKEAWKLAMFFDEVMVNEHISLTITMYRIQSTLLNLLNTYGTT